MRIWYDGELMIENGDILEVLRGIPEGGSRIRATKIRDITKGGWEKRSRVDCVLMTVMPQEFNPPLKGKVRNLAFPGKTTEFDLIRGDFAEDHIFIPAGNRSKGREALRAILEKELTGYVKICDPYINEVTFDILQYVPDDVDIFLLYEKPGGSANDHTIQECVSKTIESGKNIRVKKLKGRFHSRYILTRRTGWSLGHSLKDLGDKDSIIDRMKSSGDVEEEFDRHWKGE